MHVPSFFSSAPVLSVVINSTSEMCFSGSADSTIICWSIPSLDIDPYGPYSKFWLIYNEVLHLVSYGLSRNVSFFPKRDGKYLILLFLGRQRANTQIVGIQGPLYPGLRRSSHTVSP